MTLALSPRLSPIEANAKIGNALAFQQGITNLIDVSVIEASSVNGLPVSSVVKQLNGNPRKMYNLTSDLGVRMGVERIMCQQIYEISDEVGTTYSGGTYSGTVDQKVWGVVGDKYNQIRLVGSFVTVPSSTTWTEGAGIYPITGNQYIEIIFYGTGLNLLTNLLENQAYYATVDTSAETGNLAVFGSPLLSGRYYAPNTVLKICSNLNSGVPGWHVVKLRANVGNKHFIYGFEILNESSTLNVRPGTAYGNSVVNTLAAATTSDYKTGFDSGSLPAYPNSKGGCVVTYLKSDGTVGKSVTATDSSALYLTNTNHSNEELVRTYFWREFGSGRGDDFSTLHATTGSRAFTLDDGTTTLCGKNVNVSNYSSSTLGVTPLTNGDFISFTFVGTGLDVMLDTGTISVVITISVDGSVSFAPSGVTLTANKVQLYKVCSGLPYGTHTVIFQKVSVSTANFSLLDFRVYAPKKPSLPTGAIELSSYYVMADYVEASQAVYETKSSGTLTKSQTRELTYVGTWVDNGVAGTYGIYSEGFFDFYTSTSGSYIEYTFWGTGVEWRTMLTNAVTYNLTLSLDGNTDFTSYTTTKKVGSGMTWNAASGSYTGTATGQNQGVFISNVPLGRHTIKVLTNNASTWRNNWFNVITPIHSPKVQLEGVISNSLPIGSCSLGDSRQVVSVNQRSQKIWAQAIAATSATLSVTGIKLPVPGASVTVYSPGALFDIYFILNVTADGNNTYSAIYVDGVFTGYSTQILMAASYSHEHTNHQAIFLPRGVHKIDGYWANSGGTTTLVSAKITVEER